MSKTENYYLITGSSSGLGEVLSKQLKKSGFNTLGIDKTEGIHTDINIDLSNISNKNVLEIEITAGTTKRGNRIISKCRDFRRGGRGQEPVTQLTPYISTPLDGNRPAAASRPTKPFQTSKPGCKDQAKRSRH